MRKKILSAVLAAALLLLHSVTAFAAGGTIFQDVPEDASYAEAVATLADLGILQGDNAGNFNPDSTITRAEAAAIICRLLGVEEEANALTDSQFSDVPSNHWSVGYVAKAAELGIIGGYGNGTFGPADPVTQQQVIKMLVCAWGYEKNAASLGGWPEGYVQVAEDLGLIENSAGISSAAASRSLVAEWAYNILYVYENVE